jgi:hypothetical protein
MARILSITVDLLALSQTYAVEADDGRVMTVVEQIGADEAAQLLADNADHAAQLVEDAEASESLTRLSNVASEIDFWKRDDEKVAALTKRLASLRVEHDAMVARHDAARAARAPVPAAAPALVVHVDDKGGN